MNDTVKEKKNQLDVPPPVEKAETPKPIPEEKAGADGEDKGSKVSCINMKTGAKIFCKFVYKDLTSLTKSLLGKPAGWINVESVDGGDRFIPLGNIDFIAEVPDDVVEQVEKEIKDEEKVDTSTDQD